MELRPYQLKAQNAILETWRSGIGKTLLVLPTGCHAKDHPILMYDGSIRKVQDVGVNDLVMGSDATPRRVMALTRGRETMCRITPIKGDPFVVNASHVLSLVCTNEGKRQYPCQKNGSEIDNITVREYLEKSKSWKHLRKLYHAEKIGRFDGNNGSDITVYPYFLGILLGDGSLTNTLSVTTMEPEIVAELEHQCRRYGMTMRPVPTGKATQYYFVSHSVGCDGGKLHRELKDLGLRGLGSGDKFVPQYYKTLPLRERLEVIAGLLDTDGYLSGPNGYDFISKSQRLADDLAFMCRSVGLSALVRSCRKSCGEFVGTYYRVSISGNTDCIPCRVARRQAPPRRQKKNALRTGFSVEQLPVGDYYGFTLDGDHLYLDGYFMVHHNCGKTIVFAKVVEERVRHGDRVLVLAHREELLNQAADKLERSTGLKCALEKASSICLDSWLNVVVGSVQTLQIQKRLDRFPRDYFDTIIVDEAHHAISASYRRVIDHFDRARLLGVTATADRGDRRNLGELFETIAYEYTLPAAIRDGYLCPIKALTLPLNIDLAGVKVSAGDFQAAALGSALDPYLEQIAELMREHCAGRKTVVFLPLIATSQKMCRIMNERGISAAEVNGESDDRAEILARFHNGEFSVLCNSMLLTEGWDEPSVDCIVCLRPTKVRALYAQIVGRGTRLFPGKKDLLLLDFLWHTEKHDLCRPAHLICQNSELSSRVAEILAEESQGNAIDLLDAEIEAESNAQQEREEALRKLLEEQRKRKRQLVDPLQYEMSIGNATAYEPDPMDLRQQAPPSAAQLALLENAGIFPDEVTCAGQASKLLDTIAKRRAEGLTTPKQIRFLERVGFREVGCWRFDDARHMIDRIAANRWTVPFGINPQTYQPHGARG